VNISLSQPSQTRLEQRYLFDALRKNQISKGQYQELFSNALAKIYDAKYVSLTSSGTSALHMLFQYYGIKDDSKVLVPDLTFAGTVFPLNYLKAKAVFLDINYEDFNLDINLLREFLARERKKFKKPIWLVGVDIFGFPNNYVEISEICKKYEVNFILDAAESLGSKIKHVKTLNYVKSLAISFNGNKIVTSGGGGAVISNNEKMFRKINYWINQSRENTHWYEHSETGFNYRMSNLHAAFGYAQIKKLDRFIESRRKIRTFYFEALKDLSKDLRVLNDNANQVSNAWLSILNFIGKSAVQKRNAVYNALNRKSIETRFVWKPMSMQPIFSKYENFLIGNSTKAFKTSLCLPSHPELSAKDLEKIVFTIRETIRNLS
jgi:dTDP-4-amino-4,6-dideoxygalactose transaminase